MFDFSFAEIALIVIVCVVFIGPKDLPVIIRAVAKAMRSVKSLGREISAAFDDLAKESGLKETAESFEKEINMIKGDDGKMYESYQIPPKPDDQPK